MEKALEIASHITNPIALSAFVAVFLAFALISVIKLKNKPIAWLLAAGLVVVGIAPILVSGALAARGVYHISVVVLGLDNQPVKDQIQIRLSSSGEMKETQSGWEIDVPPQSKPSDGKLTVYAKDQDSFLVGSSTVSLGRDYFQSITIQLVKAPSATIRGEVIDEHRSGVADAEVTVPKCSQSTHTDAHGVFSFSSCVAQGEMVTIRAEKGDLSASLTVPANESVQIMLPKKQIAGR